jgi:hypothetical protein
VLAERHERLGLEDLDQDGRLVEGNAALSPTPGLGGCLDPGHTGPNARRELGLAGPRRGLLGRCSPGALGCWLLVFVVVLIVLVVFIFFDGSGAAPLATWRGLFVLILVFIFVVVFRLGLWGGPTLFTDRRLFLFVVILVFVHRFGTTTAGGRFGSGAASAGRGGVYVVILIVVFRLFVYPISPTRCGFGTSAACGAATYFGHVMAPLKVYV